MEILIKDGSDEISSFHLPKYNEIPGVGLFLEQVAKYINECLEALGEPELTGSMISNYVKKGIISNPVKKTYSRDQIACLIFIAIAKNVLSLEDINCLFDLQRSACSTEKAYIFFSEEFETILTAVFRSGKHSDAVEEGTDAGSSENSKDYLINLTGSLCITLAHKIYLDMTFRNIRAGENEQEVKN